MPVNLGSGWIDAYRIEHPMPRGPVLSRASTRPGNDDQNPLLADLAFNRHSLNDGSHVSPYDNATVQVGLDGLEVRLLQPLDEAMLRRVLSRATRATTGLPVPTSRSAEGEDNDADEMFRGGLQSSLESQVVVFEVFGASRALTHQLVRTRKAAAHQQSQRATYYGDHPEVRMPESIWRAPWHVRKLWLDAVQASWEAYRAACDAGVSYQDARYILTEGTTNYIMMEYPLRVFLDTYAYRACSMFLWEMVHTMRTMGQLLVARHPMLEPYVKISCEKGPGCEQCEGTGWIEVSAQAQRGETSASRFPCGDCDGTGGRKCTFQGWENVEGQCDKPMARQSNRVFLPSPKYRIGE